METSTIKQHLLIKCIFIVLMGSLFSCNYPYFNQPQPVDSKNLKKIPKELQGIWTNIKDTIIITKKSYLHISNSSEDTKISKSEISTDFKLVNNKLIYVGGVSYYNSVWDYVFENDTFNLTGRLVNQFNL